MTTTDMSFDARSAERIGVLLVLGAAVSWSVSGVFARLITADLWTAVCLRAAFAALYMFLGHMAVHRARSLEAALSIGSVGLVAAGFAAISMISFVAAFFHTSVANVAVIYATLPFLAAGLGWIVLREAPSFATLVAALMALVGVAIMVGGSFRGGTLLGDALAFLMATSFAIVAVIVRARPDLEMLPTNGLACLIAAAVALPLASPGAVSGLDWALLAAFAFTSTPLAFFMYIAGARRIPAAKAALISTIEVVLSPLWVYLIFSEQPTRAVIIGGAIVLAAVVWRITDELRKT